MHKETVIGILPADDKEKQRRKGIVRPIQDDDRSSLLRRRINTSALKGMRFYDLGQVNHQPLGSPAFWEDHPILKTPSYVTQVDTFNPVAHPDHISGVEYQLDSFLDSDFHAYTDMMFNYPVEEWNKRYREMTQPRHFSRDPLDDVYGFEFDMRILVKTSSSSSSAVCPWPGIFHAWLGDAYESWKSDYLEWYHFVFERDKQITTFVDFPDITVNQRAGLLDSGGYFGFSTIHKDIWKVTATNDPNAADVGDITFTENVDVYLMPLPSMWAATSNSSDYHTTEVLGLCYQINPRHLWPGYVDPYGTSDSDSINNSYNDDDMDAYMAYQIGREGMQYATWQLLGYTGIDTPVMAFDSDSPDSWSGQSQWGLSAMGGRVPFQATPSGLGPSSWFNSYARGHSGFGDNTDHFNTEFRGDVTGTDPNFGASMFQCSTPFLSGVIKTDDQFYYIWDMSGEYDGFGNITAFQANNQCERYTVSRGIDWRDDSVFVRYAGDN